MKCSDWGTIQITLINRFTHHAERLDDLPAFVFLLRTLRKLFIFLRCSCSRRSNELLDTRIYSAVGFCEVVIKVSLVRTAALRFSSVQLNKRSGFSCRSDAKCLNETLLFFVRNGSPLLLHLWSHNGSPRLVKAILVTGPTELFFFMKWSRHLRNQAKFRDHALNYCKREQPSTYATSFPTPTALPRSERGPVKLGKVGAAVHSTCRSRK